MNALARELELDLGAITIRCTPNEIAATLAWLFLEMQTATPRLRPDERAILYRIMANENGALTVGDLFPDFSRESEGHKTLRRLRAAQFIRPAATGHWVIEEPIEVKPFGRLVWDRIGESAIFPPAPTHENAVVAEDPENGYLDDLDDVIRVATAPSQEEDVIRGATAAAHEEDDVIRATTATSQVEDDDVVDLAGIEEAGEGDATIAAPPRSNWDDNVLDFSDDDDLCQYAEEELRGNAQRNSVHTPPLHSRNDRDSVGNTARKQT